MTETNTINKILKKPNLFKMLIEELDSKIAGEDKTKRALLLHCCSIWLKNPQGSTKPNVIISSKSSAGKGHVTRNIVELLPLTRIVYETRITPRALNYYKANDKNWTWDGKLLYLEDIGDDILNSEVFKIMVTEGSKSIIVDKGEARELIVKGKPLVLLTTANAEPTKEIINRFNVISLDETDVQTEKIFEMQSDEAVTGRKLAYNEEIKGALYQLKDVKVIIPYANKIHKHIPKDNVAMRRIYPRILNLIKCSSALHQYQREIKDDCVIANKDDYEIAKEVVLTIQDGRKLGEMYTRNQKESLESIRRYVVGDLLGKTFTANDIFESNPTIVSLQQWYKYLDLFLENGLLRVEVKKVEGIDKPVRVYTYFESNQQSILPKFEEL